MGVEVTSKPEINTISFGNTTYSLRDENARNSITDLQSQIGDIETILATLVEV